MALVVPVYRYKCSPELESAVELFAFAHQAEDRKTFKQSWNLWIRESNIEKLLSVEEERLSLMGYKGNVMEKMFTSVKYYYVKKAKRHTDPQSSDVLRDDSTPKRRRKYTSLSKETLRLMDDHIKTNLGNPDFCPAFGCMGFVTSQKKAVYTEINQMVVSGHTDVEWIRDKIKKTYKNRYYKLVYSFRKEI